MSYNGIGLTTPRGSGTSGYIQRNLGAIHPARRQRFRTETSKVDRRFRRQDSRILEHQRKRQVELDILLFREKLEEEGENGEELEKKVLAYTTKAWEKFNTQNVDLDGITAKDTHLTSAAKLKMNDRIRDALGIEKDYTAGSSYDNWQTKPEIPKDTPTKEELSREPRRFLDRTIGRTRPAEPSEEPSESREKRRYRNWPSQRGPNRSRSPPSGRGSRFRHRSRSPQEYPSSARGARKRSVSPVEGHIRIRSPQMHQRSVSPVDGIIRSRSPQEHRRSAGDARKRSVSPVDGRHRRRNRSWSPDRRNQRRRRSRSRSSSSRSSSSSSSYRRRVRRRRDDDDDDDDKRRRCSSRTTPRVPESPVEHGKEDGEI